MKSDWNDQKLLKKILGATSCENVEKPCLFHSGPCVNRSKVAKSHFNGERIMVGKHLFNVFSLRRQQLAREVSKITFFLGDFVPNYG